MVVGVPLALALVSMAAAPAPVRTTCPATSMERFRGKLETLLGGPPPPGTVQVSMQPSPSVGADPPDIAVEVKVDGAKGGNVRRFVAPDCTVAAEAAALVAAVDIDALGVRRHMVVAWFETTLLFGFSMVSCFCFLLFLLDAS
ncbi:MAG: hypothetical protein AAF721_26650, partial [Myxococcota bacterium]